MRQRWYIGCRHDFCLGTYHYEAFRSPTEPTKESHPQYLYVVGPFDTRRGALWAEKYGARNPHFRTVDDAEYFAAREA